jgi:RHS repeat-associated protein
MYTSEARRSQNLSYIYLGNTQVATRTVAWAPVNTVTVKYEHTDALGSIVAETDANKAIVKRNSYTAYGEAFAPTVVDGTGYTGHVMDQATGLTYMQQRYYDPQIGRFLSVDPVETNTSNGFNFSRYWYANNNPYKFTDPDGRAPPGCGDGSCPTTWEKVTSTVLGYIGVAEGAAFLESMNSLGDGAPSDASMDAQMIEGLGGAAIALQEGALAEGAGAKAETAAVPKAGIYEFPDMKAGNKPYVGQSGNIPKRLATHESHGRLNPGTAKTTAVAGGKTAREVAEHTRIQQITGGVPAAKSNAVSNKVDPIGPARKDLLKKP